MSNFTSEEGAPTAYVVGTGIQWELDLCQVAERSGIRCISLSSTNQFFETAEQNKSDNACLFIDAGTQIDWKALHLAMLNRGIEIPVVAIFGEEAPDERSSVWECAHLVVPRPGREGPTRAILKTAFDSIKAIKIRYAIERSYMRIVTLNERERAVLEHAVEGIPNKQIARRMGLHIKSIERIRQIAYGKLNVRSAAEMTRLVTLAELHDLIPQDTPRTITRFDKSETHRSIPMAASHPSQLSMSPNRPMTM